MSIFLMYNIYSVLYAIEEVQMIIPEWAKKYKEKGKEIRCIKGNYYLYKIKSVYNNKKKKSAKHSIYLGKLSKKDGFIAKNTISVNDKFLISSDTVITKKYGDLCLVEEEIKNILLELNKCFDENISKYILCLAFFKLSYQSTFKRMESYYTNSYISELFPKLSLNKNNITTFLTKLGNSRKDILKFLNMGVEKSEHILFDGCSVTTKSENMDINRVGYNAHREFDPQINLLYAFSSDIAKPVYYRVVSGNIKDVTSFVDSVSESKIENVDIVADKGFGSESNLKYLERKNINYVIPLKRSTKYFNDEIIKTGDKKDFKDFFLYNKRAVWYYSEKVNSRYIHTFVDETLKLKESNDYLNRIENQIEDYTKEGYLENQYKFGTIILISNKYSEAKEAYEVYKTRLEIEEMFDCLKNFMEADRIYMQNEKSLEAWAFINHIAMLLLYSIYSRLRKADLLKKYSPKDLIEYFSNIQRLKIDNNWKTINLSTKAKEILRKLGISIA